MLTPNPHPALAGRPARGAATGTSRNDGLPRRSSGSRVLAGRPCAAPACPHPNNAARVAERSPSRYAGAFFLDRRGRKGEVRRPESLSLGCLGTVPEKLQALANECSHIKGVRKQLSFLEAELVAIRAFLLKVAAMEREGAVDIQLKAWAREVRETSYDVEDCVDDFTRSLSIADSGQQQGGSMVKNFLVKCAQLLQTLRACHKFADQIEALKARVVEAGERRERYKLDDLASCNSSNLTIDPRISALFAEENHLVGTYRPRDELVRWLVGAEGGLATHPRVLSIVGFGGLGKTTLTRQVYHKIEDDFPYKVFLSVSQKPNLGKILRDCLCLIPHGNQISGDIETWDETKIIAEIREYLADKSSKNCKTL
ncbi:hypothetical protein C2845_PM01G39530 [Panicum miliaceum]|uniref:Uncharacterized protein n=1 Tax=Panicum miliaceum TaxID=4540 RepID=A0A3L6TI98_PANMI|nr:hypothetical protein C2845_PM01G39530 [Panicum miliaceum]